ncbi:MAG: TolC family protein [Proteiniphilum sp.]|jgi:outer membrane protein TolC|nr:TolC family protein [Proteiniphilum sp.]
MKKILLSTLLLAAAVISAFPQEVLTLERCRELALKNNVQVRNAGIAVEVARQQQKEAFTRYFPDIKVTGIGFSFNRPVIDMSMDMSAQMQSLTGVLTPLVGWAMMNGAPIDPASLAGMQNSEPIRIEALKNGLAGGIMATQPLFAGGRIVNGNRLAGAGVEVRELQKQMAGNEVLLAVERYFWQLVSMREKMKTVEDSEAMLDRILSDVSVAVEAGLTTRNDLLRVELERNRLTGSRTKVENGIQTLKLALSQMIGVPSAGFEIEAPPFDETALPFAGAVDASMLLNRPEYRLLDKNVDIAKMQVRMEAGKSLPTVAVGAGGNYISLDLHRDGGMKNILGTVFATVSVPVTDWWSSSHAVRRRKLEQLAAENTRRESEELLLVQMQQIRNELNQSYSQVLLERKSISVAEENLKISRDNYGAGVTGLSDLLEARNLLQQSADRYADAVALYCMKLSEWRVAGGE